MTDAQSSVPRARRPRKGRLALRLAVGLCLGAAAILVAAGRWSLAEQRRHLTEMVHASADRHADVILRSTRDAMLRNDPEGVRRIVAAIGAQPGIERIRVLDKQGRIHISTRAEEVDTVVDARAEQCVVCHQADRPLERPDRTDRVRVYARNGGERVLAVIAPIRNEPDCATGACHGADKRVLGVLDVQLSLGPVDEQVAASERQMGLGILATVAAMLALAAFLVWRLVLVPVRRLRRSMARAGGGDLSVRATVTSTDEIGALTASWNDLVAELERARSELETWNKTLESRVERTTQELERAHRNMMFVEKMASLGKLAAVVAHEINNPLAGIATYAALLRRRLAKGTGSLPADAETERALELVETEAIRCGGIVRNLLAFARAPGSKFAPTDLGPLLDRCVLLVKHQADLQGIRIALEIPPALPPVVCDGGQVQQAVLALATNAIEAMPAGGSLGISVHPDASAGDGTRGVVLRVADTGCGIAAQDLPNVFEPFFTTKEAGKGVGLGLAVVYGIVARHHGRVDVASEPGRGTTFTIRLPLLQPVDVPKPPLTPKTAGVPS